MTGQVDFYVLKGQAPQDRWRYACRLTEKAYLRGLKVAILGSDANEVRMLDELLWTFADQSFVPHTVAGANADADAATPVRLMSDLPPGDALATDVLVNLSAQMPTEPGRFGRICEIVDAEPERRQLGRDRFKAYRDLQLTLRTHDVASADA